MTADELELGYRTSVAEAGLRGIVVSVELDLHDTALERAVLGEALGQPIAYEQLADALHVHLGDRVPIARVRESVLALRAVEGHGARPRRPRLGERRIVLHQPDRRPSTSRARCPATPRAGTSSPRRPTRSPRSGRSLDDSPLDAFLAHQASLETSVIDRMSPTASRS